MYENISKQADEQPSYLSRSLTTGEKITPNNNSE